MIWTEKGATELFNRLFGEFRQEYRTKLQEATDAVEALRTSAEQRVSDAIGSLESKFGELSTQLKSEVGEQLKQYGYRLAKAEDQGMRQAVDAAKITAEQTAKTAVSEYLQPRGWRLAEPGEDANLSDVVQKTVDALQDPVRQEILRETYQAAKDFRYYENNLTACGIKGKVDLHIPEIKSHEVSRILQDGEQQEKTALKALKMLEFIAQPSTEAKVHEYVPSSICVYVQGTLPRYLTSGYSPSGMVVVFCKAKIEDIQEKIKGQGNAIYKVLVEDRIFTADLAAALVTGIVSAYIDNKQYLNQKDLAKQGDQHAAYMAGALNQLLERPDFSGSKILQNFCTELVKQNPVVGAYLSPPAQQEAVPVPEVK